MTKPKRVQRRHPPGQPPRWVNFAFDATTRRHPLMTTTVKRGWTISRGLTVLTVLNIFILTASIIGRISDSTVVNGVSVWDKPAKFALSFLAFGPALLWLFSHMEPTKVIRRCLGVLGWSMVAEIVLIFTQSARGTASHFNKATALDSAIYRGMSVGVGIFALAGIITGVVLARKQLGTNALALATKLAVVMMTAGGMLGFAMTRTMEGQVDGGDTIGSHTVGAADNGVGIPFLGWSTEFGDLRVAHFLGLHSLHFIPLAALLIMWLARRETVNLNDKGQRRVTALTAVAYGGLIVTTFIQALRSIPITSPDTNTWTTFVLLVVTPALAAVAVAVRPTATLQASSVWDGTAVVAGHN